MAIPTRRREFIVALGGAAVAWPLAARAQQTEKVHRIAVVHPSVAVAAMRESGDDPRYSALFKELRRLGYVEGKNLVVERYSAGGRPERYNELAYDVVRAKPDLIVASSNTLVLSLQAQTDTIPIVGIMADPVAFGNARSLARPGGNFTGISVEAGLEIWGKRLQILREIVPTAARVGWLDSRVAWNLPAASAVQEAAGKAGISLLGPPLESPIQPAEYRRVLGAMADEHLDGLIVSDGPHNLTHWRLIVDLAEKARLPTVYPYREFFDIGGLVAYGSDIVGSYRRMAGYIDEILRGAKPGEIPIYLESKFELLVNQKAAKALGITIPTSLLARADEVIE
jgi:putative tryptophan/tyrosine transport system substrate-binding protein